MKLTDTPIAITARPVNITPSDYTFEYPTKAIRRLDRMRTYIFWKWVNAFGVSASIPTIGAVLSVIMN